MSPTSRSIYVIRMFKSISYRINKEIREDPEVYTEVEESQPNNTSDND